MTKKNSEIGPKAAKKLERHALNREMKMALHTAPRHIRRIETLERCQNGLEYGDG